MAHPRLVIAAILQPISCACGCRMRARIHIVPWAGVTRRAWWRSGGHTKDALFPSGSCGLLVRALW